MSNPKVFLIDAHGLCYRAFYAIRGLANSKGQPTNAIFGVCNIIRKMMRNFRPVYMAACFDVGKKTYRQKKFADYKIQRQVMPEGLRSQIPIIHDILKAYGISIFQKEGYEADDVIATLAHRLSTEKIDVVIASDDKDLSQLMQGNVYLYSPRQARMLTAQDVQEKFGVPSSHVVDLISLAGDASDNIPGVDGIGEVSAVKLLKEYGSLENIYKHLEQIKPAGVQEKLAKGKQQARLSYELALVRRDVPIAASLEDLKLQDPNQKRLHQIFTELEFRQFAEELVDEEVKAGEQLNSTVPLSFQMKEGKETVTVVYDLKNFCRNNQRSPGGRVFDIFLAQYLLSDLHRSESSPPLREEDFHRRYEELKKQIHDQQLDFLLYEVEIPLAQVLDEMEKRGVQLDTQVLKSLSASCLKQATEIEQNIFKITGFEFNINSPKQLSEVLFERLKLPVVKKTKTGFSTDEEVLLKLAGKHPLPASVLEYRQIMKLKSTYIDALPQMVDAYDRVHASFNQTGAETGRLSSNNPNLQNIPVRTELGRQIRKAFVSYGKGHVLLSADYSQIELRLLAHFSMDENLTKAFQSDQDIHRYTASLMFEVPEKKVDERMRYAAKRINFGIAYGMSAFGLAKDLNVSQRQAQDFIDKYFLRYPKVRTLMDQFIDQARSRGFAETLFHRRRFLPDINSANMGVRQFAQRQAINAPLQGTAADFIKIAMVNIAKAIKTKNLSSTMILTVHDELVFDVPAPEQKTMAELVRHHMENVMPLKVPLKADLKVGPNWLEMKSV